MAFTSPKMGLRIWNLLTDLYDHAQLADNWAKVDYHDHSPGKGVLIPGEGIAENSITADHLQDGAVFVTADNISPAIAGARILSEARSRAREGYGGYRVFASNDLMLADSATNPVGFPNGTIQFFPVIAADLALGSLTPRLRLRVAAMANAVDPNVDLTFGLYAVSADGSGTDSLIPRVPVTSSPAFIAGSTIIVSPTNTVDAWDTTDTFSLPADGLYAFGVQFSAPVAANSSMHVYAAVEVVYV